jgi:hypothetical protein
LSPFLSLLASIPLLFGGLFHTLVENRPQKQLPPSPLSQRFDHAWETLTGRLLSEIQTRHLKLQNELLASLKRLPRGSVDAPDAHDSELPIEGRYGVLPEVLVDLERGALFPTPLSEPQRISWFEESRLARKTLRGLERFETRFGNWQTLPSVVERVKHFPELAAAWERIEGDLLTLTRRARYLVTWQPQLRHQWSAAREAGELPPQYRLTDSSSLEALHEILRPHRVMHPPFLPEHLNGMITLPIATDVADRRFLAEVEGALATYWNQSGWAREHTATFRIRWTQVPRNEAFARGRSSLNEHLTRFPANHLVMTTGGLSTLVRRQALILGPGKIQPRTLAHELGHLMGFEDCYLRTLSALGPFGIFGAAVLEWDNPLYPDDLMCDNTVGAVRAEVW